MYWELTGQAAQRRLDIESVVSAIGIFVSSTRNFFFGPHEKVEGRCARWKHPAFGQRDLLC